MRNPINNIVNAINLLTKAIKNVKIISSLAHAIFYISSSAGTTCTVAGTCYQVAGTYATEESSDFSISAGVITYNGTSAAKFHIFVSMGLSSDTNNTVINYCTAVNGVTNTHLSMRTKIAILNDVSAMSNIAAYTLQPGDTIAIHMSSDKTGAVVTAEKLVIDIQPI